MKACIDIGGTKVAVGLAELAAPGQRPAILARQSAPTVRSGAPDALALQILALFDAACRQAGVDPAEVRSAGVSSAGPFVLHNGQVELAAPNICGGLAGPARGLPNDWTQVPLEAPLAQRFDRLRVENDCVAALEAERRWGALQGVDHCAYVTWSTGIGVGLCVDGHVLRGKNGNAGHAGHSFVSDGDAPLCGCGSRGDVESLVGGNAIVRRFGHDATHWLGRASQGDPAAVVLVDGLCDVLGRMLFNLVATLDLARISLGGSVFWHHRAYLLPRLQARVQDHLPPLTQGVSVVAAGLKDQVGDYAALAVAPD